MGWRSTRTALAFGIFAVSARVVHLAMAYFHYRAVGEHRLRGMCARCASSTPNSRKAAARDGDGDRGGADAGEGHQGLRVREGDLAAPPSERRALVRLVWRHRR
jgi:hypothetical protein